MLQCYPSVITQPRTADMQMFHLERQVQNCQVMSLNLTYSKRQGGIIILYSSYKFEIYLPVFSYCNFTLLISVYYVHTSGDPSSVFLCCSSRSKVCAIFAVQTEFIFNFVQKNSSWCCRDRKKGTAKCVSEPPHNHCIFFGGWMTNPVHNATHHLWWLFR